MILTCPSCGTQYVVKDGAIPPGGRQVRCASCKHSWHQDPENLPKLPTTRGQRGSPPEAAATEPRTSDESFAEAALIEPRSGPEAEERAYEEAADRGRSRNGAPDAGLPQQRPTSTRRRSSPSQRRAAERDRDWREPPEAEPQDDEFSPFPAADEAEPRRARPLVGTARRSIGRRRAGGCLLVPRAALSGRPSSGSAPPAPVRWRWSPRTWTASGWRAAMSC